MDALQAWRAASAGIAFVLVVILLVRHVLEAYLRPPMRRALDLVAAPLFALFVLFIVTNFLTTP
ncbi:MAG TPA: hypothetical protein VEO20_09135 [Thermoplasmata archaeon]|nr:hypothetical protein [Thermoplasmata archaeon]